MLSTASPEAEVTMKNINNNGLRTSQVSIGNWTLRESLAFANLGKSTAHVYGIVPGYDDNGRRKQTGRKAPFPWLPMPDSIIRSERGRKLFLAEEIIAWRNAMRDRSRQIDAIAINSTYALVELEDN
jgi:hypothetical protein